MKGTIKKILPFKGFGFINIEEKEEDLYFHWSQTLDDFYYLSEGVKVEFDIKETEKGQEAINVTSIF